ncbi:MAG: AAA family ATPase [Acidobacteria bacterium]|nr:AAA family ATPase [Acidobacteriota bacterium]
MKNKSTTTIGGKQVQLAAPYVAEASRLVGRNHELRSIVSAWLADPPMHPVLLSAPGLGKNRVAYELSRLTGKALFILQGHEDMRADDLACTTRISDDSGRRIDYLLTPLATAMIQGQICLIDEIGKLRADAFALCASLLDERRYLDSSMLGERITAAPGFRLLAATNTMDTERIPEYVRSRLKPVVAFGACPREEIEMIVDARYPALRGAAPLLGVFWEAWEETTGGGTFPTPRDAVHIFALALGVAHNGSVPRRTADGFLDVSTPCDTVQVRPDHVREALRMVMSSEKEA